ITLPAHFPKLLFAGRMHSATGSVRRGDVTAMECPGPWMSAGAGTGRSPHLVGAAGYHAPMDVAPSSASVVDSETVTAAPRSDPEAVAAPVVGAPPVDAPPVEDRASSPPAGPGPGGPGPDDPEGPPF